MSDLILVQHAAVKDLDAFMRNFRKDSHTRKKLENYWVRRVQLLEQWWADMRSRHGEILTARGKNPELSNDAYFENEIFSQIQSHYLVACDEVEENRLTFFPPTEREREDPSPSATVTLASNLAPQPLTTVETRLPRIELPKFNGDFKQWTQFHDAFVSVVHSKPNVSNVDKLNYLKCCLSGDLKGFLDSYTTTDANYQLAWEELTSTFNNKRKLIESHIISLLDLSPASKESSSEIKRITFSVKRALASLKTFGVLVDQWDPILVISLTRRLPTETVKLGEQSLQNPKEIPAWDTLIKFLEERYRTLEAVEDSLQRVKNSNSSANGKKSVSFKIDSGFSQRNVNALAATSFSPDCKICQVQNKHNTHDCPVFRGMTVESRRDLIKNLRLCYLCLGSHMIQSCNSKTFCGECNSKHHTLLHSSNSGKGVKRADRTGKNREVKNKDVSKLKTNSSKEPITTVVTANVSVANDTVLLGTILLRTRVKNKTFNLRAIVDTASQASFLTERARQMLGLRSSTQNFSISGIGNQSIPKANAAVKLCVYPHGTKSPIIAVNCIIIPEIVGSLPSIQINRTNWTHINELNLADPHFDRPTTVDILLGADVFGDIVDGNFIKGTNGSPNAMGSYFGWIIMGRIQNTVSITPPINSLITNVQLDLQLKKFWEIENFPQQNLQSDEDIQCEENFVRTHLRDVDGRYILQLPFKEQFPSLGESRQIALKRFTRVEKSLQLKQELENYQNILKEYVDLGHLERVTIPVVDVNSTDNYCYLPHHAVFKPDSTSTRLRIVFDASCQTSNGKSLNDNLYVGPKLQADLNEILIRWRLHRFVLSADISKMYRQIKIIEPHCDYQRILGRLNSTSDIEDFRLTRVTFGLNCAPFLAMRVIHQIAIDEAPAFPIAAKLLTSDMYVDDILTGANSVDELCETRDQLIGILRKGGFELSKWSSNDFRILEDIPKDRINPRLQLTLGECNLKTLGILWEPKSDLFCFTAKSILSESVTLTKRQVLSVIAQIYDPLGWLSPVLIVGKIFMQQLWLERIDWDTPLSQPILEKWCEFAADFVNLKDVRIPRWFKTLKSSHIQLHGFCDASEKAYAAAIYIHVSNKNGEICTALITSKTKVAPVKTVTLPRLELCGAVLLARLIKRVVSTLPFTPEVHLWSDSTVVLHWITMLPSSLKTFVSNRVSEIQESTETFHWKHVRSKDNPADLASRGIRVTELINNSLWWFGPSWLRNKRENWPKSVVIPKTNIDVKNSQVKVFILKQEADVLERFSRFSHMIRVFSYVFRFLNRDKAPISLKLTSEECELTKIRLIRNVQIQFFSQDYNDLVIGQPLDVRSSLRAFTPFLDKNKCLRSCSRLEHSTLPFSEKFPIILPYSAHFTKLYVEEVHRISLHGNVQLMMALIRRKFWIPRLTNLVKLTIRKCTTCVRYKGKTVAQIMAALPLERSRIQRCFSNVGMDYCGPFTHKLFEGRCPRTAKCYALIIVCFTSRMIHLELVSELSSEAFVAAFERFISRRSSPSHVFCDNATYFTGADRIMQKEFANSVQRAAKFAAEKFAVDGIQFHFSPPGGPHFNGMAEAGVKSVKYHLKRVIGNHMFTFEKFNTLLAKIEACLNSRPLAPLSNDPEDLNPLTPAHLFMEHPLVAPSKDDILETAIPPNKYWRIVEQIRQSFWVRWNQEYLHTLKSRYKWQFETPNLSLNQLVLVKDETLPPQKWKLARIVQLHPGKDDKVRVVTIKCASGEYTRPITKLVPLPVVPIVENNISETLNEN